jgi:hypothetical protein
MYKVIKISITTKQLSLIFYWHSITKLHENFGLPKACDKNQDYTEHSKS